LPTVVAPDIVGKVPFHQPGYEDPHLFVVVNCDVISRALPPPVNRYQPDARLSSDRQQDDE